MPSRNRTTSRPGRRNAKESASGGSALASAAPDSRPAYFDCNATTPIDPEVLGIVLRYLREEFGNAGSRTHAYGTVASRAVNRAREQVASVVAAKADEVLFTSGATESNNLAVIGLAKHGEETGRRHVVTTQIEHKAVLDPVEELRRRGFDVTLVAPQAGGWVDPDEIVAALRPETLLVSVMQVNNETGVLQPTVEVANRIGSHPAYLHVDAAQGYGKEIMSLRHERVDLISISGHKVHAPKGIGALVARRRRFDRPPLTPLLYGGGQERGLRAGTLPVHLVAGLGAASELAERDEISRSAACRAIKERLLAAMTPLGGRVNGDPERTLPHVVNLSFRDLDSEAVMVALKDVIAISNGSACTSHSYTPSHVLTAMGCPDDVVRGAIRFSWSYMTTEPDWDEVVSAIRRLQ